MPLRWTINEPYMEWVRRLHTQQEPETCMAYSLCNAARMAGRQLTPSRLLTAWEERGVCIPGSHPVVDPRRALEVAKPLFRDAGIQCAVDEKWSSSEFAKTFSPDPLTHCNPAHVITLGPGYMDKYHDSLGERIPKKAQRPGFVGPGHDVLVLGMEGTSVVVHDPDPQLKMDKRDARFDGQPVVVLDRAQARTYFATGEYARSLTSVSQLIIKPELTRGTRKKGQAALIPTEAS